MKNHLKFQFETRKSLKIHYIVFLNVLLGIVDFLEAVYFHMWSKNDESLFSMTYYNKRCPILGLTMYIFDFNGWHKLITKDDGEPDIKKLKALLKASQQKKALAKIKKDLIMKNRITNLLKQIKTKKIRFLKRLYKVSTDTFMKKLILFIYDYLLLFTENQRLHHTILIHRLLYNGKDDGQYNIIKICVDYLWHLNGSENKAETHLKAVAWIFNPLVRRKKFNKLEKQAVVQILVPGNKDSIQLKKDLRLQCQMDGIRTMKVDPRSCSQSIVFRNMIEKDENRFPYGNE